MSAPRFLAGAVIGLVTGLLIAPKKGEELRNDIVDSADVLKKRFNRLAGRTGAELNDLRNILEDEISGLSDDVRHRILTILDETDNSVRNVKSNVASELR